jgi:predicted neutral ceramidase superfamily lipid hydrolase
MRYTLPTKTGLDGAFPDGGWAQGSDIDVNALVRKEKEEEEARRSKERGIMVGSPESERNWKTSHGVNEGQVSSGGFSLKGARI